MGDTELEAQLLMGDMDDFLPVTRRVFNNELAGLRSEIRGLTEKLLLVTSEVESLKSIKLAPSPDFKDSPPTVSSISSNPSEAAAPTGGSGILSYLFGFNQSNVTDTLSKAAENLEISDFVKIGEESKKTSEEPEISQKESRESWHSSTPYTYPLREDTDSTLSIPSPSLTPPVINIPYQGYEAIVGEVNIVSITQCKYAIYIKGKVMFFKAKEDDEQMHRVYVGLSKLGYTGDLEWCETDFIIDYDPTPLTQKEDYFVVLGSHERLIEFSITLSKVKNGAS